MWWEYQLPTSLSFVWRPRPCVCVSGGVSLDCITAKDWCGFGYGPDGQDTLDTCNVSSTYISLEPSPIPINKASIFEDSFLLEYHSWPPCWSVSLGVTLPLLLYCSHPGLLSHQRTSVLVASFLEPFPLNSSSCSWLSPHHSPHHLEGNIRHSLVKVTSKHLISWIQLVILTSFSSMCSCKALPWILWELMLLFLLPLSLLIMSSALPCLYLDGLVI